MGKIPVFYPATPNALNTRITGVESALNGGINGLTDSLKWRMFGSYSVNMQTSQVGTQQTLSLGGYLGAYSELAIVYKNLGGSYYGSQLSIVEFDCTIPVSYISYPSYGVTTVDCSNKSGVYASKTAFVNYPWDKYIRTTGSHEGIIFSAPNVNSLTLVASEKSGATSTTTGTMTIYLKTGV